MKLWMHTGDLILSVDPVKMDKIFDDYVTRPYRESKPKNTYTIKRKRVREQNDKTKQRSIMEQNVSNH